MIVSNIILLGLTILVAFILTYMVRKFALKKAIIDIPNKRSSHTIPTPRGGGLAVAVSWFLGIFYLFFSDQLAPTLLYAFLPGILLVIISFLDDLYDLKPLIRLGTQFIVSALALYFLGGVPKINFGFVESEIIWLWTPVALLGMIWFINLFNFLDGIDGYAAMETIFISAAFYVFFNDNFLLILAAVVSGFLIWNWQPAKIFLGDVGSTLLGFNIIVLVIYYQNTNDISLFTLLIPSVLFWFDASWTLIRRFRNKEKLTEAHKKHTYQRIVQAGFSHQKTVIYAFIINLLIAAIFFLAIQFDQYVLLFLFLSMLITYLIMRLVDKKKPFELK